MEDTGPQWIKAQDTAAELKDRYEQAFNAPIAAWVCDSHCAGRLPETKPHVTRRAHQRHAKASSVE